MTESSSDDLIAVLRKAVSRTSLLAEGNDPELDSVVRQIRQAINKGANAEQIQTVLNNAEPLLIKSDSAQSNRAQQVKSTLQNLIDLLEKQVDRSVPQDEKKQLESQIRLHWQTPSYWPALLKGYLSLAENTFNTTEHDAPRHSFLKHFFRRNLDTNPLKNDQEILRQISHTLTGLMNNLSLPSHYDEDITELKKALSSNHSLQQLPDLLDEVIHLIMITIGKNQESLTNYLNLLNKQLASINKSISHSYDSQQSLSDSREGFSTRLENQVLDTSNAVKNANDLDSLKTLIDERLNLISHTMTDYKTQIIEQEEHANRSISLLKSKVNKMEKDTVSMRSLLQERLAQAMTDSLTDLPNRTAYQDAILPLCKVMQKTQRPICLAVCDIDHFKNVNDTWGHLAGDKVLRLIPQQVRSILLKDDIMFRYGGEEFVIVFPNTTLQQAIERAEAIRVAIAKTPFNMQGEPVSISVSIGIAELNQKEEPEPLFDRADKQLYIAKESGRNKVVA
ncbi:GGDEF domain-containing protein [Marinomonas sp. IMCC 4694]|uniref:GGDEF domain-containing protein n=1 Tax=Marinomonas sp. IMCC 4694 TaxID=2605432 RepID=UPI0011E6D7CB|nr:GGDEF domain-containing protein [Marinomonas sp. IMCC 4694]TYL46825.1 GGDEF domain-containing protein [Marinomonas sp. IMCC 4694]